MELAMGFAKLPKALFREALLGYRLSLEACVLYAFLADRTCLSRKNGSTWRLESNSIFVYMTIRECMELLQVGHDKAGSVFKELESAGLIQRKRQGLGKPYIIIVDMWLVD